MKRLIISLIATLFLFGVVLAYTGHHEFKDVYLTTTYEGEESTMRLDYDSDGRFPYDGYGVYDTSDKTIELKGYVYVYEVDGYELRRPKVYCVITEGYLDAPEDGVSEGEATFYIYHRNCRKLKIIIHTTGTYSEDSSGSFVADYVSDEGVVYHAEGTHNYG